VILTKARLSKLCREIF